MKLSAADREWAKDVKERDEYSCRRCLKFFPEGKRQGLHAHHVFTRTRRSARWDIDNGVSLCFAHHMWAHQNPLEFHEWMKDELGPIYDFVQEKSRVLRRTGT